MKQNIGVAPFGFSDPYLDYFSEGYRTNQQLWGEPSTFLLRIPMDDLTSVSKRPTALDIGCGQGRNIPYLVDAGFNVVAVDILDEAIRTVRLLQSRYVTVVQYDGIEFMKTVEESSASLILANQVMQNFRTHQRLGQFVADSKRAVHVGGLMAFAYFVEPRCIHPELVRKNALIFPCEFVPRNYFAAPDYSLIYYNNYIVDDLHDEEPHRHAIEQLVIRRIR